MPTGTWREKVVHVAGSNGNSGDTRDDPYLDIGVGYTNLRFLFDGYRGKLNIGSGYYETEDWPVIKHDRGLHVQGWWPSQIGDDAGFGTYIRRPDTVASDGQPFMRPLTLAELAVDREVRENHFSVRDLMFDGNIDAAVTATTPAPPIQLSHGGYQCSIERLFSRWLDDVIVQALYDGIQVNLRHIDHSFSAAFEALQDADPFSGVLNEPCMVAIHGLQADYQGAGPPNFIVRLVGKSTSTSKICLMSGMTTESQNIYWQHDPGPLASDKGWKVISSAQGGHMGGATATRRVVRESNDLGEGAFWHIRGSATGSGDEFYESDKEGSPMTWGSGAQEDTREVLEFLMAPGWTAPKGLVASSP